MKLKNILEVLIISIFVSGCSNVNTKSIFHSKRGMLDNNTYYSTSSPNIQIVVDPSFQYSAGAAKQVRHKFFNQAGNRAIFIDFNKHATNESQIDYYEHPSHWIFSDIANSKTIETGTLLLLNKEWYYNNNVNFSEKGCALLRDLRRFTNDHDVFFIRYVEALPPQDCEKWQAVKRLTDEQKDFVNNFVDDFSKLTEISKYNE